MSGIVLIWYLPLGIVPGDDLLAMPYVRKNMAQLEDAKTATGGINYRRNQVQSDLFTDPSPSAGPSGHRKCVAPSLGPGAQKGRKQPTPISVGGEGIYSYRWDRWQCREM